MIRPKLLRLRSLDLLAGEQKFHAVLAVDVASEANDAARGSDDAQANLSAAELGVLGSDNHVAGKGDFHAAASSGAVACRDDGLGAQTSRDAAEAVLGNGLALAALRELGEVLAGAEDLAGTRHDDGAHSLVLLGVVHDVFHSIGSCAVQRIGDLGTVDADDQQSVLAKLGYDSVGSVVICHVSSLMSRLSFLKAYIRPVAYPLVVSSGANPLLLEVRCRPIHAFGQFGCPPPNRPFGRLRTSWLLQYGRPWRFGIA